MKKREIVEKTAELLKNIDVGNTDDIDISEYLFDKGIRPAEGFEIDREIEHDGYRYFVKPKEYNE